jgi:hypothetical protein
MGQLKAFLGIRLLAFIYLSAIGRVVFGRDGRKQKRALHCISCLLYVSPWVSERKIAT